VLFKKAIPGWENAEARRLFCLLKRFLGSLEVRDSWIAGAERLMSLLNAVLAATFKDPLHPSPLSMFGTGSVVLDPEAIMDRCYILISVAFELLHGLLSTFRQCGTCDREDRACEEDCDISWFALKVKAMVNETVQVLVENKVPSLLCHLFEERLQGLGFELAHCAETAAEADELLAVVGGD